MDKILLALALVGCATVAPHKPAAEVVQRQLEAYNAQDADAFAATYAEDAVVSRGPEKKPILQGRKAIRDFYAGLFVKYPQCRAKIAERKEEGNVVSDHEIITGRGPERPDPWDAGWVRYTVQDGVIKTAELP